MREIKFRALDNEAKKMVILDELILCAVPLIGNVQKKVAPDYSIQTNDIMQFTGLHDKNGKEIWEGDIIKVGFRDYKKVVFNDGAFGIDMTSSFLPLGMAIGSGLPVGDVEVIGNIYENKELLS